MRRKSFLTLSAVAAAAALTLSACGGSDAGQSGAAGGSKGGEGTIEFFMNAPTGSPQEETMKELVKEFEEETGIHVALTTKAAGFEDDVKVKMASGDLPDVFSTHGWSVLRYAPFLIPLEDEPWAEYLNPGLEDVMLDDDGHLYALPLEYGITGLLANLSLLEEQGIDVDSLQTWDGLTAAMEKLHEAGISPITSAGKDNNSGDIGNWLASGQLTQEEDDSFLEGEFSTELWEDAVTNRVQEWADNGWFNADYVSATFDDMSRQLADGSAAFAMSWPFVLNTAHEFNPDVELGFIPIPGLEPYLVGGEGVSSFGIAKDSKDPEAAKQFLAFLAEPANAERLMEAGGTYSGLTNVEVDLGILQPSYDTYVAPGEIRVAPYFDRVYLPSGMWDTIITTTDAVINKQMDSQQASDAMQAQFKTLYGQ